MVEGFHARQLEIKEMLLRRFSKELGVMTKTNLKNELYI